MLAGADFRTGRLAVVVTFDEDDNHAHNQILTAVLHKGLRATTVATRLNHLALSRSASGLVGRSGLRGAAPNLLASLRAGDRLVMIAPDRGCGRRRAP